jgi:threonyl-tRNA synthetase
MAAAIEELFPGTHLGIGPAISDGFYYNFERLKCFVEEDLKKTEDKMRELVAKDLKFEPSIVTKEAAIGYFSNQGEHLKVAKQLTDLGLRVELDDRNEKMGYKIREAQTQKIPYMLVVGDKEAQSGQVSVRNRFQGDEGAQPLKSFLERIRELIEARGPSGRKLPKKRLYL